MEEKWLITFRSVTFGQKGERILHAAGIPCTLQRTPKALSQRGCGYCLRVGGPDILRGVSYLREKKAEFEKVYALSDKGLPEEREL